MKFKNWDYRIKGGVISLIVFSLLSLINFITDVKLFLYPSEVVFFVSEWLSKAFYFVSDLVWTFFFLSFTVIIYFLIGVIIAFLVKLLRKGK